MKKGYIYAIVAAVLFGMAGLLVKMAQSTGIDSISLLTAQYMLSVIIMFAFGFIRDKKLFMVGKKKLFDLAVFAVAGNTLMSICYYIAFEYLPVATVTVLLFTYPVLIFIFTCIFEKTNNLIKKAVAICLAFTGCLLVLNFGSDKTEYPLIGIALGILCAVFYAFMNIYCEKRLNDVDAFVINAYTALFTFIVLCIYKFPFFIFEGKINSDSLFFITLLAIFSQIIPLTLVYSAIKHIGALKVSIIENLELPAAALAAYVFLGEKLTIIQIIGSALIIVAVILIQQQGDMQADEENI